VAFLVLGVLAITYLVLTVASAHPYYLDYYNSLAGGPANVHEHRLFEFGWWGEGVYECVEYVGNTAPGSTVFVAAPNHFISLYGDNATYICPVLPDHGSALPINATDYVITNVFTEEYLKLEFPGNATYAIVYEADAQGTPLAKVYKKVS
jgi:hypothetical protein